MPTRLVLLKINVILKVRYTEYGIGLFWEADIHTWLPIEQKMTFMLGKHTDFDPVLSAFKELIEAEGEKKLRDAGIDTSKLKNEL